MKILMISDVYFPRVNGVSTSIYTFRNYLVSLGHEVHLICPAYHSELPKNDDPHIYRLPGFAIPFDPEDRLMRLKPIKQLLHQFRALQFDLIHIQTPFIAQRAGLYFARKLGIPVVVSYHTHFEEYFYHYIKFLPSRLLKWLARRITRRQCSKVNAVIAPSRVMMLVLREYGVLAPIDIIPTGLDLELFKNADGQRFRDNHNIPAHRPTVVHVGRIAFEKNIEFLLLVLQEIKQVIPEILMIIAGEGPAKATLQQKVKHMDLDDNVRFFGYLSRHDALLDCYAAGDVFVFSSKTETQGLVLLEAMALGVPVVSIAAMGTKDILTPQLGCIIAEENLDEFVSKTLALLRSPVLRAKISFDASRYAATWSNELMTTRLVNFYSKCLTHSAKTQELSVCITRNDDIVTPVNVKVADK